MRVGRKQAALLDYFEGVAAGPGQFRRARRLMQRRGRSQ